MKKLDMKLLKIIFNCNYKYDKFSIIKNENDIFV